MKKNNVIRQLTTSDIGQCSICEEEQKLQFVDTELEKGGFGPLCGNCLPLVATADNMLNSKNSLEAGLCRP